MHGYDHIGVPRDVVLELRHSTALAIYVYLVAKGPNWQPHKEEIQSHFLDVGRPKYQQGWNLLKKLNLGWITTIRKGGRMHTSVMNFSPLPVTPEVKEEIDRMNTEMVLAGQNPDFRYRADVEKLLQATKNGDMFKDQETVGQKPDLRSESTAQESDSRSTTQESDSKSEANENEAPTPGQISAGQECVSPINNTYFNNKAFASGYAADSVYKLTRTWLPDDIIASNSFPGYPIQFIEDMTGSFLAFWLHPDRQHNERTHLSWMNTYQKHLEVNWEKHKENYGETVNPWEKRGFKSEGDMRAAQDRAADIKTATFLAKDLRAKRDNNEPVPEIPAHLVHLIDPNTLEVVTG